MDAVDRRNDGGTAEVVPSGLGHTAACAPYNPKTTTISAGRLELPIQSPRRMAGSSAAIRGDNTTRWERFHRKASLQTGTRRVPDRYRRHQPLYDVPAAISGWSGRAIPKRDAESIAPPAIGTGWKRAARIAASFAIARSMQMRPASAPSRRTARTTSHADDRAMTGSTKIGVAKFCAPVVN
ncbi:hypothetical protein BH10PSE10_BH10PSE10_24160 [soil metagenome]